MDVPEYDSDRDEQDECPVDNPVRRKKEEGDGEETSD